MKKAKLSVIMLTFSLAAAAQTIDSLKQKSIDEVVITGQYNPQSINKSIYKVEVIDAQQIKNMAATTVADVLNQNLNIQIIPDRSSGNSTVNIMGLSGYYTKILIDNIPVVSDEGAGNNIDLTKINLNNIERIEIVKGSMGVEYGNNAVTGVINIITKKGSSKKVAGSATLQEETVRNGYDWYKKGNGRHIQNLFAGINLNKNWYASVDINHNDFQGYQGSKKGYRYFSEGNDGLRGYDWQPKDQINAGALLRYSKNSSTMFYKVSLLSEEINYRDPLVEPLVSNGGMRTYISKDRDYFTRRWIHQFNIMAPLGNIHYIGDFSYQTQERQYQNYNYDVPNRKELSRETKNKYYDTDIFYSRGMFSNFLNSNKFDFRLGYELDRTSGFASSFAGDFGTDNIRKTIFNYAHFLSAEWNISRKLSLRPGARLALSDRFRSQYNYSLTAKYAPSEHEELRFVAGSANRFPSYDELYTYFVDANHDVRGNQDLKPETGYSVGAFSDYRTESTADWKFNISLSAMYLRVKHRISLALVSSTPLQYQYMNIDDYKSQMYGASFTVRKDSFYLYAGTSLLGISQKMEEDGIVSPDDFRFYLEANAGINYSIPNWQTLFALYYKYTGKSQIYTLKAKTNLTDPSEYILGEVGDYSMMNFTIMQPFFNRHLEVSAGIKNIFDVRDVKNTAQSGGAHNTAASQQNLFYGRSYFARLSYNF